jgi:hypothetical protein
MTWPRGLQTATNSSAVKTPPTPTSVNWTPAFAPDAPVSYQTAWLSRLEVTRA